jgi:enterochelin esterase family protein
VSDVRPWRLDEPGDLRPWWLDGDGTLPDTDRFGLYSATLLCEVRVEVWSPPAAHGALPLLVANDGPEYACRASLTRYAAAVVAAGRVPPFRVALLAPGHRDAWYSANPAYAKALCTELLPALRRRYGVASRPVAMGASLGALAMLHAQRRHRGTFCGLFLQSGSFFTRELDPQESGFAYFGRIARRVGGWHAAPDHRDPVPAVLTCGRAEENLANNRAMAAALARQRYPAVLHEVGETHDFISWRDALHPHLTDLLAERWTR